MALFFVLALALAQALQLDAASHKDRVYFDKLSFVVLVSGANSENSLDTVSISFVLEVSAASEGPPAFSCKELSIIDRPYAMYFVSEREFTSRIVAAWFSAIELYRREPSAERTYVSVNNRIIEAYVVEEGGGKSYRDLNTGLYLGGEHVLAVEYGFAHRALKYVVEVLAYLVRAEPDSFVKLLHSVDIDVNAVRALFLSASLVVVATSIATILNRKKYEIV